MGHRDSDARPSGECEQPLCQPGSQAFQVLVYGRVRNDCKCREPACHGERVAREGSGLIDRPIRSQLVKIARRATQGADRQSATDNFAQCHKVCVDLVASLGTFGAHAESGHHLICDEECSRIPGETPERFEKLRLGEDEAHVSRHDLDEYRSYGVAFPLKESLERPGIVEWEDTGELGYGGRYAGRTRMTEGERAGSGLNEQAIRVSVIGTFELHDEIASGYRPGQADRAHRGLGSRAHEADAFNIRDPGDEHAGEFGFSGCRCTETEATPGGLRNRCHNRRMGMSCDQGAPGTDVVDIAASIGCDELGTLTACDEDRRASDTVKGPDRRVDSAGNNGSRLSEALLIGLAGGFGHGHRFGSRFDGRVRSIYHKRSWGGYFSLQTEAVASPEWALELSGVTKSYGSNPALVDGTFSVRRGEIFGLLGPNGAGKTTLVEILLGIKHRDGGRVHIMGVDPELAPRRIRELISGQLQISPFQDKIRVFELLDLFAALYPHPRDINELLDLVGLAAKRNTFYEQLSGGQKQRLALALALVGDTDLVILDEPTTGLDAQIRRELHAVILELSRLGKTLLLTTHYIEEAEKLCARVAILFRGRVHAIDTPQALIARYTEGENLEVTLDRSLTPAEKSQLQTRFAYAVTNGDGQPVYRFHGSQGERLLVDLVLYLSQQGIGLEEARIRRPSLEEAYLTITGSRIDA